TGDSASYLVERILAPLQDFELAMDPAHEFMEMQACLADDWNRLEEAVHQEALAPPDAAVHPDAARDVRAGDHAAQAPATSHPELDEFVVHALQPRDRGELGRVGPIAPRRKDAFILLLDVHVAMAG